VVSEPQVSETVVIGCFSIYNLRLGLFYVKFAFLRSKTSCFCVYVVSKSFFAVLGFVGFPKISNLSTEVYLRAQVSIATSYSIASP